MEILNNKWQRK